MNFFCRPRHRSFFPVILALLTLLLAGLVILSVRSEGPRPAASAVSAPTEDAYRAAAKEAMRPYDERYDTASTDLERLLLIESVLGDLLDVTVPSASKDLHFELVVALNAIRSGLRGEGGSVESGRARLEAAASANPWLK